jgi:protein-S-isoprenylcysteine O-methyltransferase Ste14
VTLADRLHAQGRRLFARRSIMPLTLLPVIALALPHSATMEATLGPTASTAIQWLAFLVAMTGLFLRCITVSFAPDGTSSRDTRGLRAPSLNNTGVYSIVRHPLYLGAGLMWIGVAMSMRVWWVVLIVGFAYWLYIERVMLAEEAFLNERFGDQFRQWAARTPAFIPRLSQWQRQAMPFQGKRLLSEHNGLLAVALLITGFRFLGDTVFGGQSSSSWPASHADLITLTGFAIAVSVICVVVRRSPWMQPAGQSASLPNTAKS